jgi:hypothetical protein
MERKTLPFFREKPLQSDSELSNQPSGTPYLVYQYHVKSAQVVR